MIAPVPDHCLLIPFPCKKMLIWFILRLHYVSGSHGGHVSDNRDQNGITMRQCRATG